MRRARELEPLAPLSHALSSDRWRSRRVTLCRRHGARPPRRAASTRSSGLDTCSSGRRTGAWGDRPGAGSAHGRGAPVTRQQQADLAERVHSREHRPFHRSARSAADVEADARDRYVPPFAMALVNAGLGERDAMFDWLDKGLRRARVHLIYLPVDSKWDPYPAPIPASPPSSPANRQRAPPVGARPSGPRPKPHACLNTTANIRSAGRDAGPLG